MFNHVDSVKEKYPTLAEIISDMMSDNCVPDDWGWSVEIPDHLMLRAESIAYKYSETLVGEVYECDDVYANENSLLEYLAGPDEDVLNEICKKVPKLEVVSDVLNRIFDSFVEPATVDIKPALTWDEIEEIFGVPKEDFNGINHYFPVTENGFNRVQVCGIVERVKELAADMVIDTDPEEFFIFRINTMYEERVILTAINEAVDAD